MFSKRHSGCRAAPEVQVWEVHRYTGSVMISPSVHKPACTPGWQATGKLSERPLSSSGTLQLLEKRWLGRCMIGIVKITQPNAHQAEALLWTQVYALA